MKGREQERESLEGRQIRMVSFVRLKGYTRFSELASLTGVSELTVRRDLQTLHARGVLNLVPGGATADPVSESMIHFREQVALRQAEKMVIARAAASLVHDGDTILMDGGTTTYYAAQAMKGRRLQVVTNSLPIADVFSSDRDVRLVLLGGTLYPDTGVTLGPLCEQQLQTLNPGVLFIGVGGVTEDGLTNSNIQLVQTEQVMMKVAEKCIVVADSSKFGRRDLARLADLGEVDVLVTDSGVSSAQRSMLTRSGVELIVARPDARKKGNGRGNGK